MEIMKARVRLLALMALTLLCATSVAVTNAHAQLPGESTLGQFLINLGAALLATIQATGIGNFSLLVAARDYEFRCTSFVINEGKIESSTDGKGKLTSMGCKSFSLSTGAALPCDLKTLETITASALVLPVLHGGQAFLLFEPQTGSTSFTIISYKSGGECPLPLNNPVTGSLTALMDALDAVEQTILFSPAIQLLTGDKLAFGGFPAYVHREVKASLTGVHAGQKLGVH